MDTGFVDITYEIEFFSNWHCGSGLAAGADVDALVVKDKLGLPYVPGRTLKGLLREAAGDLYGEKDSTAIDEVFGLSGDAPNHQPGLAHFGNATFTKEEMKIITDKENDLTGHLYQTFASTAIREDGIADDGSLRKIETVVPCKLQGSILNVPTNRVQMLEDAMMFVKRMGTGRTRGYGRCKITITGKDTGKEASK